MKYTEERAEQSGPREAGREGRSGKGGPRERQKSGGPPPLGNLLPETKRSTTEHGAPHRFPAARRQPCPALPRLGRDVAEAPRRARRDARVLRARLRQPTSRSLHPLRACHGPLSRGARAGGAIPRRRRQRATDLHARHNRVAEPRRDGVGHGARLRAATRSWSRRSSTMPTSSRGSSWHASAAPRSGSVA